MAETGKAVDQVNVELAVVLGQTSMPIHQLLKMGRGAVIELDSMIDDPACLTANGKPIAKGNVVLVGDIIAIEISETMKDNEDF